MLGGARNEGWTTTLATGSVARKNSKWVAIGLTTGAVTVRGASVCVLRNRHDKHSLM